MLHGLCVLLGECVHKRFGVVEGPDLKMIIFRCVVLRYCEQLGRFHGQCNLPKVDSNLYMFFI